ncbi:hypothetical protein GK047_04720 [Paenibacillus sp. SYP-B3998]|uniref:SLH domain-containing protein n=1 Tax=Paenibacillus sp. SYP-B3998 TaxID=2678564 RepID=A0A6G3ZSY9_9BACL|nr:S-layer homology domain-containing protein [Paenibacillus sp. SYP-B3998]NEW05323.1 hypothetical protein [Paenibacillus sp. SYP-B3998]
MLLKSRLFTTLLLVLVFTVLQCALAVSNLKDTSVEPKFEDLQRAGFVSGLYEHTFAPKSKITVARGTHLIVKGLNLNIDRIQFIKEPKASDYFDNVPNNAWYAPSLIIAYHNGIVLKRDLEPDTPMTREQFAQNLHEAMQSVGINFKHKTPPMIKDKADFSESTRNAVQDLVKFNIIMLEDGNYRPKAVIIHFEAADMLNRAIQFIQKHSTILII